MQIGLLSFIDNEETVEIQTQPLFTLLEFTMGQGAGKIIQIFYSFSRVKHSLFCTFQLYVL